MPDFKIFYLRICFMLFISVEFSIAAQFEILDPSNEFEKTAAIDILYVKRPNDDDFTLHSSAKPMLLSLHRDGITMSFHENDAPLTYFSFTTRQIDFESFHSQSMAFSVKERPDVWHFRCIFAANKITLDYLYPYLSLCMHTAAGYAHYCGDIKKVQLYISAGRMRNPIVRNVEDLKQAEYYENVLRGTSNQKIFSITPPKPKPGTARPMARRQPPRFVFRTNRFRVKRQEDKVVLNLSGFESWFYIFYFENEDQAINFMEHLTNSERSQDVTLEIPPDLQSYLGTAPNFETLTI